MDTAEKLPEALGEITPVVSPYRSILIIGGHKLEVDKELSPHRVLTARGLEFSLEVVRSERPDLILYFDHGRDDRLEEHVMTWLIEGFRGKIVVLDPSNRIKAAEVLLEGQVIDDHLSGPVSLNRFVSIIKSHLGHSGRSSSPRALTTFDLFRNLYERGINAIFFLSEDLERCLAANLAAEQVTGRTLYELRHVGLKDICDPAHYEETESVIRRAARRYYDMRGQTAVCNRGGGTTEAAFSCSWMNFGRRRFVKLEVQTPFFRRRNDLRLADRTALLGAVDQSVKESKKAETDLSLLTFQIASKEPDVSETREMDFLSQIQKTLNMGIRHNDRLVRMGYLQFAVLLPKTDTDKAHKVLDRLMGKILQLRDVKDGVFMIEKRFVLCPPEAFPFLDILSGS